MTAMATDRFALTSGLAHDRRWLAELVLDNINYDLAPQIRSIHEAKSVWVDARLLKQRG